MNKPSKCKNCQWYGKPYWSIINPCDNCPMENVETFTVWQDPTIKEKDKEIERLRSIINELEKDLEEKIDEDRLNILSNSHWKYVLDKLQELKGSESNE